jgi:hypothetical protein
MQVESEGGALHVETEWAAGTGNSMVIIGAKFVNNTSGVTGGAVVVNGQSLQLQDTLFERNSVGVVITKIAAFETALCCCTLTMLLHQNMQECPGRCKKMQERRYHMPESMRAAATRSKVYQSLT